MPKSFLINPFFVFMLRFKLFDYLDEHVIMLSGMLRNDPGLLFYDLPKKGFHGNFDLILDFPGIPSEIGF